MKSRALAPSSFSKTCKSSVIHISMVLKIVLLRSLYFSSTNELKSYYVLSNYIQYNQKLKHGKQIKVLSFYLLKFIKTLIFQ